MSRAIETVRYLGRCQGRHLTKCDDVDDAASKRIPYVVVSKDPITRRYRVRGGGHRGHDNEARMALVCDVLETRVLPRLPQEADVCGCYSIELHDSYSYLVDRNASEYRGAMTFSKRTVDTDVVCVPDVYQLLGYGGRLFPDPYGMDRFETKLDGIVGAFTTTGDRRPEHNVRVQTCLWSLAHRDRCHLYITSVAQMCPRSLLDRYPQLDATVMREYVHPSEQQRYKFILNLPGNTETWDMAWMLNSNSVVVKRAHGDMCWYSPMLLDGTHVVRSDADDDILKALDRTDARTARFLMGNAHRFVQDFMVPAETAYEYWAALWEESCEAAK